MTQGAGPNRLYKNVFDCAVKIYQQEGAKAFLRGWEPRVTWIAIGGCVFFTALEQAKKVLVPPLPEDSKLTVKH
jgi:solute carrier family 25 (mitochondrial S-adenosylmethionine transporter), member 26